MTHWGIFAERFAAFTLFLVGVGVAGVGGGLDGSCLILGVLLEVDRLGAGDGVTAFGSLGARSATLVLEPELESFKVPASRECKSIFSSCSM